MSQITSVSLREMTVSDGAGNATQVGTANLYDYAGLEGLTLGQLVNAVCVHAGVALEDQTVNKMNIITVNSRRLKAESEIVENIVAGTGNYDSRLTAKGYEGMTYREFLQNELKLTIGGDGTLPASVSTYDERMKVFGALKEKLTADATAAQQDMIDLQTYESRRDVAYSTATNIVKNTGMTKQMTAANLR